MTLCEYMELADSSDLPEEKKNKSITRKIKEVARSHSRNFVDFIAQEPSFNSKEFGVFVAGLIELLCSQLGITPPDWIFYDDYYLDEEYSEMFGYDGVPWDIYGPTLDVFKSRGYYTGERGLK